MTMHLDLHRVHLFESGELGRNVSLNGGGV
jgi:hypothetical protein